MWNVWGRSEMHAGLSRETIRKETTWKTQDGRWWSGLMWLWIGDM
jgi:hypothetical protein